MINLGASGYLCKGHNIQEVVRTINNVFELGYYLDTKVEKELQNIDTNKNINQIVDKNKELNNTEKKVLNLICKQKLNKEIAHILGLSIKSIEYHRSNLLKKTNSINVVGLVYYAFENMIDID